MTVKPTSWIGMSVERVEDLPLVTGRGNFAGDVSFQHQLHMRVVRSPYAHGLLKIVEVAEARKLPGVIAVWTTEDIADLSPIDFREGPNEKLAPFRQPVLAKDYVRYAGEPLAAVFAIDPYVAEDATDLIIIEVDELDAGDSRGVRPHNLAEIEVCLRALIAELHILRRDRFLLVRVSRSHEREREQSQNPQLAGKLRVVTAAHHCFPPPAIPLTDCRSIGLLWQVRQNAMLGA